jgi:hypothetical protein
MGKRDLGITAVAHSGDTESPSEKNRRIRQELTKAGMSFYGLSKFNTRYLPSIIKDDEHIHGVVYGRHVEGSGFLNWVDRMMVATDHRIISFNHKPGYTDDDVFTYDVVNGVDATAAGPFRAVTLDTRTGKVTIRFVNKRCAEKFIKYVAERRMTFFKTRTQPAPKS